MGADPAQVWLSVIRAAVLTLTGEQSAVRRGCGCRTRPHMPPHGIAVGLSTVGSGVCHGVASSRYLNSIRLTGVQAWQWLWRVNMSMKSRADIFGNPSRTISSAP